MGRHRIAAAVAAVVLVTAAGCSSDDEAATSGTTAPAADAPASTGSPPSGADADANDGADGPTVTDATDTGGPTVTDAGDDGAASDPPASGATPPPATVDATADDYRQALAERVDVESFPGAPEEATCMTDAVVDAIGADVLAAAGVTPEALADRPDTALADLVTPDAAVAVGDAVVACLDDPAALMAKVMAGGSDPATLACVRDELADEDLGGLFATIVVVGGDEPPPAFLALYGELVRACPGMTGSP